MREKNLKKDRGITLIALVVTIVVLLILAGISISMVLGNNGVISKAKDAKAKTEQDAVNTETAMNNLYDEITSILGNGGNQDEDPEVGGGDTETDEEESDKLDTIPGELSGEGTESNPYLIESIEDLVAFSNNVNSGTTYYGDYISLNKNLNFNSNDSYIDPTTTEFGDVNNDSNIEGLKIELTTGNGFIPIGNVEDIIYGNEDVGNPTYLTGNPFKGNFDGKNKSIEGLNIVVNADDEYLDVIGIGLFGWTTGTVKNLNVEGKIECFSNKYVGGIAALANGEVNNCTNNVQINAKSGAGGIVGAELGELSIKDCKNVANLTGTHVGGIIGTTLNDSLTEEKNINIEGSYNIAELKGQRVGGIIGYNMVTSLSLTDCYNTGKILADSSVTSVSIGGLVGYNYLVGYGTLKLDVVNCYNSGEVYSNITDGDVGGIIGYNNAWRESNIINVNRSFNMGNIYSDSENTGGISGNFDMSGGVTTINNTYNTGNISGNTKIVGGIAGYLDGGSSGDVNISNCYNSGNIECVAAENIGGIIAKTVKSYESYKEPDRIAVSNCYNLGNILTESQNSSTYVGGIIGSSTTSTGAVLTINQSVNKGNINYASGNVGGILGAETSSMDSITITECYYGNSGLGGIQGNDVTGSAEYAEELPDILTILGEEFENNDGNITLK